MSSHSANLVEYLAAAGQSELPAERMQRASQCLLDTLGCGLFGAPQARGGIVNEFVLSEQSRGVSTLYGSDIAVESPRAALANGTSTHRYHLDDILHCH